MSEFTTIDQDPANTEENFWLKRRAGMNAYLRENILTDKQQIFIKELLDPDSGPVELKELAGLIKAEAAYLASLRWEPVKQARVADMVVQPEHYSRFKLEPTKFSMQYGLNWCEGNALKYLTRYPFKNGIEDLRKAARYLEMYVKWLEGDPEWSM